METIPLFKVAVDPEAVSKTVDTLLSGYIGQGQKVELFESAFKALVDAPVPPLTTNSATSAISLALRLLDVGPGDEVISTPMTCAATNAPIVMAGAKIRWADVDPMTGLINPVDVQRRLTPRTKAIIAVDWGGHPCDYVALKKYGVPVIEDAAHALMATVGGQSIARVGGDYVVWSFQAIKHLTTGDGGALLAPRDQMERGRLLRWYGLDRRSKASFRSEQNIEEVGTKWHMNDIAAAIGLGNMSHVVDRVMRCRENAATYDELLSHAVSVVRPEYDKESSWWLYTLLVERREEFIDFMKRHGIVCGPVHSRNDAHIGFKHHVVGGGVLPGVEHFSRRQVSIPVGWWLTHTDVMRIADVISVWNRIGSNITSVGSRASVSLA